MRSLFNNINGYNTCITRSSSSVKELTDQEIPSAGLPSQSGKSKQANGESHALNARITKLHVKLDSYSMCLIVFLCFLTRKSKRFRFKKGNHCSTCVSPADAEGRQLIVLTLDRGLILSPHIY